MARTLEMSSSPLAGAPKQAEMSSNLHAHFAPLDAMLVKQTARGCIKECLGCEARSEFMVSAMDWQFLSTTSILQEGWQGQQNVMYALEESNCCIRICWPGGRPFQLKVSSGGEAGGDPVISFNKDCGCPHCITFETDYGPVAVPCCCFLPQVRGTLPNGTVINESKYICDQYLCVPKFAYTEDGQEVYRLRPATCCMDCCIRPRCQRGTPGVEFNFYKPDTMEKVVNTEGRDPAIIKVWTGLAKECCTTADNFAVFFPPGCTPERKAGILGLTFLTDFLVFEGRD